MSFCLLRKEKSQVAVTVKCALQEKPSGKVIEEKSGSSYREVHEVPSDKDSSGITFQLSFYLNQNK